ncbi:hypothetical protein JZ751_003048, partial [Albula glossodonta]
TNKKPCQVSITKVKQFEGSSSFVKRSQWTIEQLRQVNGIDPNRDCPEFDLMFDNAFDQWVASSAGEKCTFVQILHHTCQRYSADRKPEFVSCQSKLLGGCRMCSDKLGRSESLTVCWRDLPPALFLDLSDKRQDQSVPRMRHAFDVLISWGQK